MFCVPYICLIHGAGAARGAKRSARGGLCGIGASDRQVILRVCVPAAGPAILTGALLALAISVGETAPLIYTAGWSSYLWDGRLTQSPIGYLTYVIWTFINEPFAARTRSPMRPLSW